MAKDYTIWKFPLSLDDEFPIEMPIGAKVLYVAAQAGTVCLWAMVNPCAAKEIRHFCIRGEDHPIGAEGDTYHGSAVQGPFVWHVFERQAVQA